LAHTVRLYSLTCAPQVISVLFVLFTRYLSNAAHFNTITPSESMARCAAHNFEPDTHPFGSPNDLEKPTLLLEIRVVFDREVPIDMRP